MKIEASVLLGDRDEEVEVQGESDCWGVGRRRCGAAGGRDLQEARDSNGLYYQWKSKYSGVSVSELKRVRELESENSRLKKMYAELALENTAIKDVLSRKL